MIEAILNSQLDDIPHGIGKGTYVLILRLKRKRKIKIGRRKGSSPVLFRAGYYAYVGSAFGPGGLSSRIKRHLRKGKLSVWHIDYLRREAVPVEVWICNEDRRMEPLWADALIRMEGAQPVERFGNTDDRGSRTHLCYFEKRPRLKAFREKIERRIPASLMAARSPQSHSS